MKHFPRNCAPWAGLALLVFAPAARADVVRFRYVPVDAQGTVALTPIGPGGAPGVRSGYRGGPAEAVVAPKRPTHVATVVHPRTGRTLFVPLTLPDDTPRIERRMGNLIYNYGTYTVEVRFLDDGAVEVIYNSGFLRPL
jgi:hypothetical protein